MEEINVMLFAYSKGYLQYLLSHTGNNAIVYLKLLNQEIPVIGKKSFPKFNELLKRIIKDQGYSLVMTESTFMNLELNSTDKYEIKLKLR